MMDLNWKYWVAFLAGVIFVLWLASVVTSLWVVWELLPPQAWRWAYATDRPELFSSLIEAQLPIAKQDIGAVAVAQGRAGLVVVLRPRGLAWGRVRHQFQAAGWQVERSGWWLRAWRGESSEAWPIWQQAIHRVVVSWAGQQLPLRPAVIGTNELGFGVGVWHQGWLRVAGTFQDSRLEQRLFYAAGPKIAGDYSALVAPGSLVRALPGHLQQELNQQWAGQFGFSQTTPLFLPPPAGFEFMAGRVGEETFIGQRGGKGEFLERLAYWLQAEDSRLHPLRRSFRLPDGTRGYESVPGQSRSVLASTLDGEGCRQTLIEQPTLWVCEHEDVVVISREKLPALRAWQRVERGYAIRLGADLASQLPIAGITDMSIWGSEDYAVIDAFFAWPRRWP